MPSVGPEAEWSRPCTRPECRRAGSHALRMTDPVVGHLDPGECRVPVEDDAEEVVRLALVPVGGRVHAHHRRDVRVCVRAHHLEPDPAVVRHRQQVVDGVELAVLVVRVVHARDPAAELEAEGGVVTQVLDDRQQVLPAYVERDLTAVDHDLLDGVLVARPAVAAEHHRQPVGDLVEPPAVRRRRTTGQRDRTHQAAVAGRVAAAPHTEGAAAHVDDLRWRRFSRSLREVPAGRLLRRAGLWLLLAAHRSSSFTCTSPSCPVGTPCSALCSASASARCLLTPSLP